MVEITAQVSVYPLRKAKLGPAIAKFHEIARQHGLEVAPGPMSTLVSGDDENVFAALQDAFRSVASDGQTVMVVTLSNACPVPDDIPDRALFTVDERSETVTYHPIGYVQNAFDQSSRWVQMRSAESRIILDSGLEGGLQGLEPGQQVMVLYYFDRIKDFELLQHPRGDPLRPRRGVFTLRSPRRPNPIGVTMVELLAIDNNVLTVQGLDAFDGTPVLDLKPA